MSLLINFIGFQLGWFAAVLGGANDLAWAGTLAALVVVIVHLLRINDPGREVWLLILAAVIGFTWESVLVWSGVTVYPSGVLLANTAPHWIVMMWVLFATTLNISMRWLRGRWWLASGAGAVFGPLAFYAGFRMGGVVFPDLPTAMMVLATGWAVLLPLLMQMAEHFDGTVDKRMDSVEMHHA